MRISGCDNQTLHRRLRRREINLKDLSNVRNTTKKIIRRVKNSCDRFVKKHIQISINKLRDGKKIVPKFIHKSDIIQGEMTIYFNDVSTKHLSLLVIPKSHILLVSQGNEAGEPFLVSGHML
jgi:hypothetical protein